MFAAGGKVSFGLKLEPVADVWDMFVCLRWTRLGAIQVCGRYTNHFLMLACGKLKLLGSMWSALAADVCGTSCKVEVS